MYGVTARVNYTDNVLIDTNEISFGDIYAGETAISLDTFTITINIGLADQEPPNTQTGWLLEYQDANGIRLVEEILLK